MQQERSNKDRILIINPPIQGARFFPMGLGYIAAVLKKKKYEIDVLDVNAFAISNQEVEEKIKKSDCKLFLTGAVLGSSYNYIRWVSQVIKRYHPDSIIVAGSSVASSVPRLLLQHSKVDYLVMGEGEQTIIELLDAIENKRDLSNVNGIAFKNGEEVTITAPRYRIDDLDSIPFPAWDLFPMEVYVGKMATDKLDQLKGKGMIVTAGRGCPYRCTYCYHVFGYQSRMRSVENVLAEIEELKKRYGVKIIYFVDDLFMINKEWTNNFCDELLKRNLNILWRCAGRVNLVGMGESELLKKMRKAGCIAIQYGIETASPKLLKLANKQVTVEQMYEALKVTRLAGIEVTLGFMIGFPEESKETVDETVHFCIKNDIQLISMFFVTPYPGTPLYDEVRQRGLIKDEERYLEHLHNAEADTFNINLTRFTDNGLFNLRDYAINKVNRAYFRRHRTEYSKWIIKKQMWHLRYIKQHGLISFINAGLKKFKRKSEKF